MIRRQPITFFIIFTFLLSYAVGIPVNILLSGILSKDNEVLYVLLPRVATVYGPAIAALIVSYKVSGSEGVKRLFRKLLPSQKHVLYFIIIPLVSATVTIGAYSLAGLRLRQLSQFIYESWWLLLFQWIMQFLIVGIGEETGWRGWLFPRVLKDNSFTKTVALLSVIWGLWHLPILFRNFNIVYPWLLILLSVSIILSWLWLKVKGNLFVIALAHASVNAPQAFIENRMTEARLENEYFINGWEILGYVYLILALALLVMDYSYLKREHHIDS